MSCIRKSGSICSTLICDDNVYISTLMCNVLQLVSIDVLRAISGAHSITMCHRTRFSHMRKSLFNERKSLLSISTNRLSISTNRFLHVVSGSLFNELYAEIGFYDT